MIEKGMAKARREVKKAKMPNLCFSLGIWGLKR